jgi:hypothetical protein
VDSLTIRQKLNELTPAFPHVYFRPPWTLCCAGISVFAGIERTSSKVTVAAQR